MAPTLYGTLGSPPYRCVLLVAKALGVDLTLKEVNVVAGETRSPEFRKISPQHAVPVLDDDGFIISESRAIIIYLAEKYDKNFTLLPQDIKQRATLHSRLYFDATTLYLRHMIAHLGPVFRKMPYTQANLDSLAESLSVFDELIGDKATFLVGDKLTIADIALLVTVSNIEAVGYDISKYKNVGRWLRNAKIVTPGYQEVGQKGADLIAGFVKPAIEKLTPQ